MSGVPGHPSPALPELLAPVGDWTCLTAAIQGGCDAVYFGVETFNMRTGGARNFCADDLAEVARTAREGGVRAYLTVNSIVFEHERADVSSLLEQASGHVNAVICWDPFVIAECRRLGLPIHISTQASVANSQTAAFYRELGARRVVPARECTLEELIAIRRESGMELEVFVHGAMCMAVSGRCFLSQDVYGRSANRGECLQNCRRVYRITDIEEGAEHVLGEQTVLSAKDLCTMPFLDRLLDAGLDAFKIEGRGRNPEYVQTVVNCYRHALNAWHDGRLTDALKAELTERLRGVFNRDFSGGFLFGRPIAEFTDRSDNQATRRKHAVGVVANYYPKLEVAVVKVQNNGFREGHTLMIQGPTTGSLEFAVRGPRQAGEPVCEVRKGEATFVVPEKVRRNDKVYRLEG